MVWFVITLIFSTILDIITISHQPTFEKDLEILFLSQQISILNRKINSRRVQKPHPTHFTLE